jgi:hypothetical protein
MASLHASRSACVTQRVESRFAAAAAASGDDGSADQAAMDTKKIAKTESLTAQVDISAPPRILRIMTQSL